MVRGRKVRLLKEMEVLKSEQKEWKRKLEGLEMHILDMMGEGNRSKEIRVTKEGKVEIVER